MSFNYPWMLFLLLIPAVIVAWIWRRSGRHVVLPLDHSEHKGSRWLGRLVNSTSCLPALGLAVVIIVLSGPLRLSEPKTKRRLTNIEFCVDISGSMTAPFGDGSRYDASMKAINDFLDYREGDAFGLTFFGNNVLHWVPLTSDTSAVRCSPPFMRPENVPPWFGGTMIGKALRACQKVLVEREEGDRTIVLVSDGSSGDSLDDELARKLRQDNIAVYAIHIGSGDAPAEIVNITSLTGGEVFVSGDVEGLKGIFKRIDEMKQTKLEKTSAETMDNYAPWCILGLSVLGMSLLTSLGLRYTPW
jgi:Ca-activated chloride channel family protein